MLAVRTRAAASSTERVWRRRRMVFAGPLVAIASMIAAVLVTNAAGLPVRDPDHVAGKRLLALFGLVGLLFMLDIVVRAEGSRIVLDPELKKVLTGNMEENEVAPRAAAAWLAHSLVEEGGGQIQVADGEANMLIIGASLPA